MAIILGGLAIVITPMQRFIEFLIDGMLDSVGRDSFLPLDRTILPANVTTKTKRITFSSLLHVLITGNRFSRVRNMWTDNRRFLVIGAHCQGKNVDSCDWENIFEDLNLTDYNVIIFDLVSLRKKHPFGVDDWQLPSLSEQFAKFLFTPDSEAIIIGQADTRYTNTSTFIEYWLGEFPAFQILSGATIRQISGEFAFYFQHVKQWFFHLTNPVRLKPEIQNKSVTVKIVPIAQNRLAEVISFKLEYVLELDAPHPPLKAVVIWLPEPTEIHSSLAVKLILERRYGKKLDKSSEVRSSNVLNPSHVEQPRNITAPKVAMTTEMVIDRLREIVKNRLKRDGGGANYKYDVFISYRRDEAGSVARMLAVRLRENFHPLTRKRLRIFYDVDSLQVGQNIDVTIEQAVKSSACFIVLLTPMYAKSEYTAFESILISSKNAGGFEERVFPVKLDNCEIPNRLSSINYLDLTPTK